MAYRDELGSGRNGDRASGHNYQDVRIGSYAKAMLGDTYNVGLDDPLKHLPYAANAAFNALAKQHEPTCLSGTRTDLLSDIYGWADGQDGRHIFWLNGLAGTGKSTISRTVARHYHTPPRRLGASFFFSRRDGDVGHARAFVTTIAVQLACNVPESRQHISKAVAERSDIVGQSLRDQWNHLVLGPLSKLQGPLSYVLIIDALDECDNENDIKIIIQLLTEIRSLDRVRLRVLITSRPEVPIRHGFSGVPRTQHQNFVLHNISLSIVNNDIGLFLQHYLRNVAQERSLGVDWPGSETIKQLVHSACGLFIWAATAWRFIRDGKQFAVKRLETILASHSSTATAPEKQLNEIYITVLKKSVDPSFTEEEKEEQYSTLRYILGGVVGLFSPLSIDSLSRLLHIQKRDIEQTLHDLYAILDIPEDRTRILRLHHPSFRDFVLNKERCGANFWVDEKQAHQKLLNGCIKLMATSLKQDICSAGAPGMLAANIERSQVEQNLPSELQYACLYWYQHLHKSGIQPSDNDQVHQFLQEHLLHWLEALGWLGKVPEGVRAIASLDLITSTKCPSLSSFIHDAKRFALYNRAAIEQAPLQTYSGLIFAPTTSIVRRKFERYIPKWIGTLPKVEEKWNAVLQTLEGHTGPVKAVVFSPDGKTLASASNDGTVKLWDAGSGAVLQTLKGYIGFSNTFIFSPDGKMLVLASDRTVKLWDTGSGAELQTFEGDSGFVRAVTFLPDGKTLVSASDDGAVKLWDTGSGAELRTFGGDSGFVRAVTFSPDGKTLVSASDDGIVKLWDTGSGAVLQTFEGYISLVNTFAFSPDGKMLVLASDDDDVKLWDTSSGVELQTLEGYTGFVNTVTFSPDGKTLVSASDDRTVKLWDTGSGAELQTLESHTGFINTVTFSPDGKTLASASDDRTVKLWDTSLGAELQTFEGHTGFVRAVTFSPDGKTLVSASDDRTVKLWDTGSGAELQTLESHTGFINTVTFSPDGKTLASVSDDGIVKLWDTSLGAELQTFEGHTGFVRAVAFSPDGKTLAWALYNGAIMLWDAGSGAMLQMLKSYMGLVITVAFSPDGKTLASTLYNGTIMLWDAGSGAKLQTLKGYMGLVSTIAFSPDSKTLASVLNDGTVKLWDTGSGAVLQTLKGYIGLANTIAFSPDSKTLALVLNDGTVKLLDASSGKYLSTIKVVIEQSTYSNSFNYSVIYLHTSTGVINIGSSPELASAIIDAKPQIPQYQGIGLDAAGAWITYNSENLLWLPSEYRPSGLAVSGNFIAIGTKRGRVWTCSVHSCML